MYSAIQLRWQDKRHVRKSGYLGVLLNKGIILEACSKTDSFYQYKRMNL